MVSAIDGIAPTPPSREAELRSAAEALQVSLFTEFLKESGLMEAIAPMGGPMEALQAMVLEVVAQDLAASETQLADQFYRQLKTLDQSAAGRE
ncbi:hypothetical protein HK107_03425 [Parvularcula sp. ZS-1/3]|uniref:Uncharacterized protein n=1 Tax=Parvularcula mediterranea TaxID=2732508 RepID=A0A7Y3RJS0_9PROT|nr:hypothetical protein [Parvularcula mediterranea]NNU15377.1 hypothetical protein [Parvularcula mediterranea]